jgi:hypothetical protein
MAYHHSQQLHRRQKRSRRILKFSFAVFLIAFIAGSAVLIDNIVNGVNSATIASSGTQAKVQSASINIFRTPHFQFQADKDWREVTEEGSPSKFIYRSYNKDLVEFQFVVEVDEITPIALDNENTTRVIPVTIKNNKLVADGPISDHCESMLPEAERFEQVRLKFKETEFACNPDGSSFVAVAGLIGGNEFIEHTTAGVTKRYKLTFQDATYAPSGRALSGIINSFQLL